MTNIEWIKTLDERQLSFVLVSLKDFEQQAFYRYQVSEAGVEAWLKEEHDDQSMLSKLVELYVIQMSKVNIV